MILALVLATAQAATAPDDDRVNRIGGETHVLRMRLQSDYFGNPSNRIRLTGQDFAPACAAYFLALRRIESAYAEALRPSVISAVRAVVPSDRLAAANDGSLLAGPGLTAWRSRFYEDVEWRAADLLLRASADHQRLVDGMATTRAVWPDAEVTDRTNMNAAQLAIACATYFGENREEILAVKHVGETD